jgi:2-dehydropantoate 2-reductase
MHVAILGAGALGRVYGTRLACETAGRVSFVVRPGHEHGAPYRLQRVDGEDGEHVLGDPIRVTSVPPDADVVLVCVRAEQLDEAIGALGPAPHAVIVTLTPLMPSDHTALHDALGDRLVAGMPGVVAYFAPDGHVRYWLPRVATTLIEEHVASSHEAIASELARALDASGVPTRRERGVHETNAATTITFMPLTMGLAAAGGVEPLLADDALLDLAIAAAKEAVPVAETVGRPPSWVEMLVRFVNPGLLKVGVGIAKQTSPEAVRYVDQHFGTKLTLQSVAMGRKLALLAEHEHLPHASIDVLAARVEHRVGGNP